MATDKLHKQNDQVAQMFENHITDLHKSEIVIQQDPNLDSKFKDIVKKISPNDDKEIYFTLFIGTQTVRLISMVNHKY